jgi:hypothetical protein
VRSAVQLPVAGNPFTRQEATMSNFEIDPNKVMAEVFTAVVKDLTSKIADYVKSPIAKLMDAFRFSMDDYVKSTLRKCSNVRTF